MIIVAVAEESPGAHRALQGPIGLVFQALARAVDRCMLQYSQYYCEFSISYLPLQPPSAQPQVSQLPMSVPSSPGSPQSPYHQYWAKMEQTAAQRPDPNWAFSDLNEKGQTAEQQEDEAERQWMHSLRQMTPKKKIQKKPQESGKKTQATAKAKPATRTPQKSQKTEPKAQAKAKPATRTCQQSQKTEPKAQAKAKPEAKTSPWLGKQLKDKGPAGLTMSPVAHARAIRAPLHVRMDDDLWAEELQIQEDAKNM